MDLLKIPSQEEVRRRIKYAKAFAATLAMAGIVTLGCPTANNTTQAVQDMSESDYNTAAGISPTPVQNPGQEPQATYVQPSQAPVGNNSNYTEAANQTCEAIVEQGAGQFAVHKDITGVASMDQAIIDDNYQETNASMNGTPLSSTTGLLVGANVTFNGDCAAANNRANNDPTPGLTNVRQIK